MKLGNDLYLPTPVQAFLRDQGGGKAMILMVIDAADLPDCTPEHGMFVRGLMTLTLDDCRDPGDSIEGWRADQILVRGWDSEAMPKVKEQ